MAGILTQTLPLTAAAGAASSASPTQLIVAALVGVALIILLITALKVHPFLALLFGSFVMALIAGTPLLDAFSSFTTGLGSTVGGVGVLIVLGSMIGELLIRSGGADQIVETIIGATGTKRLPWAMALIAFIIGIPLFFEVGVVLMVPVIMLVARRTKQPLMLLAMPALAGLVCLHCFVPPHPGPLIAIDTLGANIGLTLGIGLIIAIPTVIIAGPLLARPMAKLVPTHVTDEHLEGHQSEVAHSERPSFFASVLIVLIPVVLMLLHSIFEIVGWESDLVAFLGKPLVALLVAVLYGIIVLGLGRGKSLSEVSDIIGGSFAPIASVLLIVGAGGGFKETLVDSGIADVIGGWLSGLPISPLLAAWLVAAFIRVATGSATVATITAAGIVAPLAAGMVPVELALMALAIGAGSTFLSHVNDAGFWLVKEYFHLSVGQTFKTWSVQTCLVSVLGIVWILLINVFV
ncbi:GntP family gluconate:proton (H+) symporter [Actinobaculum suis]|uniref:GntP family gluconate:proton (H+) symporter n=1 Tax=Actinobaculum suis TaxID=1657 RepID=A0A7Z8Y8A6_9ACTO|nr:gluconate:H+ symporter [Actinobaculum suis]VDG76080.1 GntP family gluconate:proton (H+) symporter [Actinobaculum suis]